jgi:uncharacterized protein (TIGR03435 family)
VHRFALCLILGAPSLVLAQAPIPADLRFEVASLKPSLPGAQQGGIRPAEGGARYVANNCSVKTMITVAYRVRDEQVVGGPAWLGSDLYDMEAKAVKPSTPDELHVMLMNLLVDRMQLKFHHEKKEMPMYALMTGKGGPKLTPHDAANAHDTWIDVAQEKFLHLKLTATAVPLDFFAFRLGTQMDRPVVDETGLKGEYDFTLTYTRDLPLGFPPGAKLNGVEPDTTGPSVFDAVKQQLGLELKAQRGPVETIVIDRAEKPSAN